MISTNHSGRQWRSSGGLTTPTLLEKLAILTAAVARLHAGSLLTEDASAPQAVCADERKERGRQPELSNPASSLEWEV